MARYWCRHLANHLELVCWLWHSVATAVALKNHEHANAFNLVVCVFALVMWRGLMCSVWALKSTLVTEKSPPSKIHYTSSRKSVIICRFHHRFGFNIFGVLDLQGGQNLGFPADFAGHHYNSVAAIVQPMIPFLR